MGEGPAAVQRGRRHPRRNGGDDVRGGFGRVRLRLTHHSGAGRRVGIARIAWHLYTCVCPAGAFLECAGARVLRWADKGRRELRVGATEAAPQTATHSTCLIGTYRTRAQMTLSLFEKRPSRLSELHCCPPAGDLFVAAHSPSSSLVPSPRKAFFSVCRMSYSESSHISSRGLTPAGQRLGTDLHVPPTYANHLIHAATMGVWPRVTPDMPAEAQPSIGLIGMGAMGSLYARSFSEAGWKK